MQLRFSRGYTFDDSVSTPIDFAPFAALDHDYSFAPLVSGGFALTDVTTGESLTFANLDGAEDSLLLDFSDLAGSLHARGGANGDVIFGGSGDDTLIGGGGADKLYGGAGDDALTIGGGYYASVDGGDGFDSLFIEAGASVTFMNGAATGIERVVIGDNGSALFQYLDVSMGTIKSRSTVQGTVTVSGTEADDRILGGAGQDRLFGNSGDDTIVITSVPQHIIGGEGFDTLVVAGGGVFALGDMHLTEFERFLVKDGSTLDVSNAHFRPGPLLGSGSQGVTIIGSDWKDRISGTSGDDVLTGGYGGDKISGGAGADTFVFRQHWDIGGDEGRDRITDFSHADGDRISLEGAAQYVGEIHFIGDAAFSGSGETELRAFERNGKYVVQGDVNHDGNADFAFFVTSLDGPLTATDFVL